MPRQTFWYNYSFDILNLFQKEDDDDDYFGDGPLGQKMPKPEPEPGEMIPEEPATGKKGKRKKKKKGQKAVS